jgi:hypothetical protein
MKTSLVSYGDNFKIVVLKYGSPKKLGDYYHHFIGRHIVLSTISLLCH